jgi:hypothetical protein
VWGQFDQTLKIKKNENAKHTADHFIISLAQVVLVLVLRAN